MSAICNSGEFPFSLRDAPVLAPDGGSSSGSNARTFSEESSCRIKFGKESPKFPRGEFGKYSGNEFASRCDRVPTKSSAKPFQSRHSLHYGFRAGEYRAGCFGALVPHRISGKTFLERHQKGTGRGSTRNLANSRRIPQSFKSCRGHHLLPGPMPRVEEPDVLAHTHCQPRAVIL